MERKFKFIIYVIFGLVMIERPSLGCEQKELIEIKPFPKIGPMIRDLTPTSITVVVQGDIPDHHFFHQQVHQNNTGIVYLRSVNDDQTLGRFVKFVLKEEDRHVGHLTIDQLNAGQNYTLKIGYVPEPITGDDKINVADFEWTNAHELSFKTPMADKYSESFSILAGSCRRIGLKTKGWKHEGDKTADAMYRNIVQAGMMGEKTDSIALIGDQIYADASGSLFFPAKTFGEYSKLYEKAFSQPYFRKLASTYSGPIHMMRDDHELWNNADAEEEMKYPEQSAAAYRAYALYQRPFGEATPNFWFTTSNGVEMFFVDTRSEREPSKNKIMSDAQLNALKAWLSDDVRKDYIKIIATSVPFFMLASDDSWSGFPEQRLALISHIIDNNIHNVMFLSGDAHCQNDAMYRIYESYGKDTGREFLEVLVSGIFAVSRNKADLLTDKADLREELNGYFASANKNMSETTLTENLFARISGNHKTKDVRIQVYSSKNKLLKDVQYKLS